MAHNFKVGDKVRFNVDIPNYGSVKYDIVARAGELGTITDMVDTNNTGGVACCVKVEHRDYAVIVSPYGLTLLPVEAD